MRVRRAAAVVLLLVAMASVGAAAEVDYSTDAATYMDAEVAFSLDALDASAEYSVVRVLEGGGTETVRTFTSSDQGRAEFSVSLSPRSNGVAYLEGEGWHYRLVRGGSTVQEVPLYWGFTLHGLDTFDDGVRNDDLYDAGSEGGGSLTLSGAYTCIDVPLDAAGRENMTFSRQETQFALDRMRIYEDRADCRAGNDGQAILEASDVGVDDGEVWAAWRSDGETVEISGDGGSPSTVQPATDTVYVEFGEESGGSNSMDVEEWSVRPGRSLGVYGGLRTFGDGSAFYNWTEYDAVTAAGNVAGIEWDDGSGFASFFGDVEPSTSLTVRNGQNATITRYTQAAEESDLLRLVSPEENANLEQGGAEDFTVQYNVPFDYDGYLSLEFRNPDGGVESYGPPLWRPENLNGTFGCPDNTGQVNILCQGDYMAFEEFPVRGPGAWEWRVTFNTSSDTDDPVNEVFSSEWREFDVIQADRSIEAFTPRDGVTFVEPPVPFEIGVSTEIDGVASVRVDGEPVRSWSVGSGFDERLRYNSPGFDAGQHTWRGLFNDTDGVETYTASRSFTYNESLADDYNLSISSPAAGSTLYSRPVNLSWSADVADSGTLRVYVDGSQVDSRTLNSPGSVSGTTPLYGIGGGERSAFLTFTDSQNREVQGGATAWTMAENVTVEAVRPEDGAEISRLPAAFTGRIDTTAAGEFGLQVLSVEGAPEVGLGLSTDTIIGTAEVDAFQEGEIDFSVSDLSSGKYLFRFRFASDASGDVYTTEWREVSILGGVDEPEPGEEPSGIFAPVVGGVTDLLEMMGSDARLALAVVVHILMILLAGYVAGPISAGMVGVIITAVLAMRAVYPGWVGIVLVVSTTALLAWGAARLVGGD